MKYVEIRDLEKYEKVSHLVVSYSGHKRGGGVY